MNNVRYMIDETDAFIAKVFAGDDRYIEACGGMVAAHGDKSEQYRSYWESQGIPFYKAQIIYFLTYTKLLGDTPKYKSKEWVVENFHKYEGFLPTIKPWSYDMNLEVIVNHIMQHQVEFGDKLDVAQVLYPRDFIIGNLGVLEDRMVKEHDDFGRFCIAVIQLAQRILSAEQAARDASALTDTL